jgi:hypothetical protein
MYAQFVNGWLNEYGEHVTRAKHKAMRLEAGRASVTLKHYGEKGTLISAQTSYAHTLDP